MKILDYLKACNYRIGEGFSPGLADYPTLYGFDAYPPDQICLHTLHTIFDVTTGECKVLIYYGQEDLSKRWIREDFKEIYHRFYDDQEAIKNGIRYKDVRRWQTVVRSFEQEAKQLQQEEAR